jgi:arginyl-tRNA synthetase
MSIRTQLHGHIVAALQTLAQEHGTAVTELPRIALVPPKMAAHGDYSTPIALALGRKWGKAPKEIATRLQSQLGLMDGLLSRCDVAGPGHLNFFVDERVYRDHLHAVLSDPDAALVAPPSGEPPILLEYVSANPTGPLHVAHGRGAVHGDVLARLLTAAGRTVKREYYINDMGRQTDVMAESIYLRYGELLGRPFEPPTDFYPGAYITDIAQSLIDRDGDRYLTEPQQTWLPVLRAFGIEAMLSRIQQDLCAFNVPFDSWVSEQSICQPAILDDVIERLHKAGHTFVEDGKLWFKSTTFGDDKDRVLRRDDGRPTYFLTDLAYHDSKMQRGYKRLINIWGADHGGYVARLRAGLSALGHDGSALEVLLVQMVSLSQGGEAVRMGKRLGTAVWLAEVVDKAGADATRYLFSMRRIDAQMDFDIDLAMRRSIENPVYYAQMGHARLAAIGRKAQEANVTVRPLSRAALDGLTLPEEVDMLRTLARGPDVIEDAAAALEPHQVVHYMQELIAQFHSYYTRYKHTEKVISSDPDKTQARLLMCQGLQAVLKFLLTTLGVSAPLSMSLDEGDDASSQAAS